MQYSWLRDLRKFEDKNGHLRVLFCGLSLFFSHALRDYLITGLPQLILEETINKNTTNPQQQFEWSSSCIGMCMASAHLGSFLSLVCSPFICKRFSVTFLVILGLWATGFLSFFSQVCFNSGIWGLVIIRMFIGFSQGPILLYVYLILRDLELGDFTALDSLVFFAPWLGSALAMLMAAVMNPFITTYIMGVGILGITILAFKLPFGATCNLAEDNAWKEAFSSKPVLSCVGMQTATVYVIHTFFLGLPYTLCFKFGSDPWWWFLVVMTTVAGVVMRCLGVIPLRIINTSLLSALNRRRVLISTGSIIILLFLTMCGTVGLEEQVTLNISCAIGLAVGTSLGTLGIRMSLHDLAPIFPIPVLLMANAGASLGAMLASIMFPSLALMDYPDEDFGMWVDAWIIPCIFVTASTVSYLLLLSVNPLPHQVILSAQHTVGTIPQKLSQMVNGTKCSPTDPDAKSFKSLHSAGTFKTALSSKHRSSSFHTIAGNTDVDVKSIPPSEHTVCKTMNDGSSGDFNSVKFSIESFKTVKGNGDIPEPSPDIVLDAVQLDRTTAWLTTHHSNSPPLKVAQRSTDKLRAQRNMLLPLQW